jgi:hypothetical protein
MAEDDLRKLRRRQVCARPAGKEVWLSGTKVESGARLRLAAFRGRPEKPGTAQLKMLAIRPRL